VKQRLKLVLIFLGVVVVLGGVAAVVVPRLLEKKQESTDDAPVDAPKKAKKKKDDHKTKVSTVLPILPTDPSRGTDRAPVTIVELADFSGKDSLLAQATVEELRKKYTSKLRLVWKDGPSLTTGSRSLARTARTVALAASDEAFFRLHDRIWADFSGAPSSVYSWMGDYGVDSETSSRYSTAADKQIDENLELAKKLVVTVTPTFFINGERVLGSAPQSQFEKIIDHELEAAKKLVADGMDERDVYATRTDDNYMDPEPPVLGTLYDVSSAGPSWGQEDALVTIVIFGVLTPEYDAWKLADLGSLEDTRVVFHDVIDLPEDRVAAAIVRAIGKKAGDSARRDAIDEIRTTKDDLSNAWLQKLATKHGVPGGDIAKAIADAPTMKEIDDDVTLGHDVDVFSSTVVFVNGRRITTRTKKDLLTARDYELKRAKKLLARGTPRAEIYETLVSKGKTKRAIYAPLVIPGDAPVRGPATAKITIQVFADFENSRKILGGDFAKVVAAHKSDVRIVFRHLATTGEAAAQLAIEAKVEKDDEAFFKIYDALVASTATKLDRATLDAIAKTEGLDATKVASALDTHKHKKILDDDAKAAAGAGITAAPTFVIGDVQLPGTASAAAFEAAIARAKIRAKP